MSFKLHIPGFILFFVFLPGLLSAKNVVMPITIDHSLLNELVVSQLLTTPKGEHELLNDPHGCRKIVVSEPRFSEENSLLKFEIKVRARAGIYFANTCFLPIEWEGVVVFFQTPVIEPGTWMLSFQTSNSRVLNKNHEPEIISGTIWKLIRRYVHAHINSFQVNLGPLVGQMKSFMVDLFPESKQTQALLMAESMKPVEIRIGGNSLQIFLNTDISSVYNSKRTLTQEHLNEDELETFVKAWESTDDFLVYLIGSLSDDLLDQNEKELLFETLLDTRYRFIAELSKPVHENDFVRNQFILAWETLSGLFKAQVRKNPGVSPWEYLSFFSSMEALMALDSMGPSLGIEISHRGLVRLARLIPSKNSPLLFYSMEIDENLRELMNLDPLLKESPEFIPEEPEIHKENPYDSFLDRLLLILNKLKFFTPSSQAIAADLKQTSIKGLEEWVPPRNNPFPYVKNFRKALKNASGNTLSKGRIDKEFHDLFPLIVDAVAWQESCLRQFEVKNGKIKTLRSYNNTSVGAMQINERVWRGIYDQEKLRWNIHYNMDAGSEILALYLDHYILRKTKEKNYPALLERDNIARLLYALYNSGPGEFSKFLDRISKKKLYLSDALFYEKFLWVKNSQWENAGICF